MPLLSLAPLPPPWMKIGICEKGENIFAPGPEILKEGERW